jgi:hypothetical protein
LGDGMTGCSNPDGSATVTSAGMSVSLADTSSGVISAMTSVISENGITVTISCGIGPISDNTGCSVTGDDSSGSTGSGWWESTPDYCGSGA